MTSRGEHDATFSWVQDITANRVLSCGLLFVFLCVVVGFENPFIFLVLLFVGYLLLDRYVNVRRCITLGGAAWIAVALIGWLVSGSTPAPIFLDIDYLFMFCGFLFAVAVCLAYFVGLAMYGHGLESGLEEADTAIAQHIVDRLIDHPDDWSSLDGDYLEVESALNRVRERHRTTEQAARDEARRKDDLVTYLAHDLKTPLASVVGYLSLLEEAPDLPVEHRVRFTGIALEKAHRLDALIEEFFDITRFDFHDIVLTRGYVDLNLMLGQVVDEFYPTLTEQGKQVALDVPLGLTALIDGDKMARVFNNVMKNAIAYSYDGSTIRIAARRVAGDGEAADEAPAHGAALRVDDGGCTGVAMPDACGAECVSKSYATAGTQVAGAQAAGRGAVQASVEAMAVAAGPASAESAPTAPPAPADKATTVNSSDGSIVITFENQGDPIPAPKLKVIFEKFYRLDAARSTNRGGAGLGLAIAKEIVAAHGGTIGCASSPERTVFTITLPAS